MQDLFDRYVLRRLPWLFPKRPTPARQFEPPGFLALNYGRRTPISVLLAHLIYGAIIGTFYQLA
jgi:hypothetical protein